MTGADTDGGWFGRRKGDDGSMDATREKNCGRISPRDEASSREEATEFM